MAESHQQKGDSSLEPKKRGFQKGTHLRLIPEEKAEIQETVITRRPEEFGIPGSLLTRRNIQPSPSEPGQKML